MRKSETTAEQAARRARAKLRKAARTFADGMDRRLLHTLQGLTSFERAKRDSERDKAESARSRADEPKRQQLDKWRDAIR